MSSCSRETAGPEADDNLCVPEARFLASMTEISLRSKDPVLTYIRQPPPAFTHKSQHQWSHMGERCVNNLDCPSWHISSQEAAWPMPLLALLPYSGHDVPIGTIIHHIIQANGAFMMIHAHVGCKSPLPGVDSVKVARSTDAKVSQKQTASMAPFRLGMLQMIMALHIPL